MLIRATGLIWSCILKPPTDVPMAATDAASFARNRRPRSLLWLHLRCYARLRDRRITSFIGHSDRILVVQLGLGVLLLWLCFRGHFSDHLRPRFRLSSRRDFGDHFRPRFLPYLWSDFGDDLWFDLGNYLGLDFSFDLGPDFRPDLWSDLSNHFRFYFSLDLGLYFMLYFRSDLRDNLGIDLSLDLRL